MPSIVSSVSPGSSTDAAGAGVVHVPSAASSRQTRSATTTLPGLIVASNPSACRATYWATWLDVRIICNEMRRSWVRLRVGYSSS